MGFVANVILFLAVKNFKDRLSFGQVTARFWGSQCRCGLFFATDRVAWSVCRSVCHDRELCKKRLNRSRCRLGCGLGLAQGIVY